MVLKVKKNICQICETETKSEKQTLCIPCARSILKRLRGKE